MSEPYYLRCWTRFHASPEEVWAIKASMAPINRECAPLLQMIPEGDALDAALRDGRVPCTVPTKLSLLGGLPGPSWPVEITAHEPGRRFVDCSENAWFSRWEHEHLLEPASDGTLYTDAVTFTPRLGPARLARRLLLEFFLHRHRQAARYLPTDKRATAVAVMRALDLEPEP